MTKHDDPGLAGSHPIYLALIEVCCRRAAGGSILVWQADLNGVGGWVGEGKVIARVLLHLFDQVGKSEWG